MCVLCVCACVVCVCVCVVCVCACVVCCVCPRVWCRLLKDLYKVKVFQRSLSPEKADLSEVVAKEIEVHTIARQQCEYTCQCSTPAIVAIP